MHAKALAQGRCVAKDLGICLAHVGFIGSKTNYQEAIDTHSLMAHVERHDVALDENESQTWIVFLDGYTSRLDSVAMMSQFVMSYKQKVGCCTKGSTCLYVL